MWVQCRACEREKKSYQGKREALVGVGESPTLSSADLTLPHTTSFLSSPGEFRSSVVGKLPNVGKTILCGTFLQTLEKLWTKCRLNA